MEIKQITAEQTYALRQKVLRKGKALSACKFEFDFSESTLHYGLFKDDEIVAILSVFESTNSLFASQHQLQLRGMAIDEKHQGHGYGKTLIHRVLEDLKTQKPKAQLIWCNARKLAFRFYQKQGFEFNSDDFEIEEIGTHRVMSKTLMTEL
ncbi:MAG: GNAT family N-acetyltransferase [Bdellovibrionales bacterium]|nr:GNAT family N-acetyltransferase [Bdellovibrionales bacterium]